MRERMNAPRGSANPEARSGNGIAAGAATMNARRGSADPEAWSGNGMAVGAATVKRGRTDWVKNEK